jgi:hypothetical protein
LSWAASSRFFLQGKNELTLVNEGRRELYLNVPHSANPSAYAEPVDTLVAETLTCRRALQGDERKMIEVIIWVDDPGTVKHGQRGRFSTSCTPGG